MSKIVLPLRFNWKDVILGAGWIVGLLLVITAAIYGAIHGAHAAGVMGGVIGAVAWIVAAALLCLVGFLIPALIFRVLDKEKGKGVRPLLGVLLLLSGAIYGAMLGSGIGANALGVVWTKVGQVIGGLLLATLGSLVGVFVFLVFTGILDNLKKDRSHAEAGKT